MRPGISILNEVYKMNNIRTFTIIKNTNKFICTYLSHKLRSLCLTIDNIELTKNKFKVSQVLFRLCLLLMTHVFEVPIRNLNVCWLYKINQSL